MRKIQPIVFFISLGFLSGAMENAGAAVTVEARISSKQAYVGAPLLLQVTLRDADTFDPPEPPVVDGLSIESAGPPTISTQTSNINGQISRTQSAIFSFRVIAERSGEFTIPSIPLRVDGVNLPTTPLKLTATVSETGDLLIAEVDCDLAKAYVGQTIPVTLRFWVRPYRSDSFDLTFDDLNTWNLISERTEWGPFEKTVEALRSQQQRPAGRLVSRDDGRGVSQSYWMYEIDTTFVPQREGPLVGDDVTIIVNYPTKLGRGRDPIRDFFQGTPFGASPFSGFLDEDDVRMVGRLKVLEHRPLVVTARSPAIEVMAVPSEGRPANYRGAVGDFKIQARAATRQVEAGDPIEMTIAISGSGALDLVQPPPLGVQSDLASDFRFDDQPMGGYVKDDTKYFGTSIRPRSENVTEIPAIAFSYFDPLAERFETVASDPIPIVVTAANVLDLPPAAAANDSEDRDDESSATQEAAIDWSHDVPLERLLVDFEASRFSTQIWIAAIVFPPLAWAFIVALTRRRRISEAYARLKPHVAAKTEIARADSPVQVLDSLIRYVERRFGGGSKPNVVDMASAAGVLRLSRRYDLAASLETLAGDSHGDVRMESFRETARLWVTTAEATRGGRRRVVAAMIGLLFVPSVRADSTSSGVDALRQAQADYARGLQMETQDASQSGRSFIAAADQYQLAIDAGIDNPVVRRFLADAQFKSGDLAAAVVHYRTSWQMDPNDEVTLERWRAATQALSPLLVNGRPQSEADPLLETERGWDDWLYSASGVGSATMLAAAAWLLTVVRTITQKRFAKYAVIAMGLTLVCCVLVRMSGPTPIASVVFSKEDVTMRSGDGNGFEPIAELSSAYGHEAVLLDQRSGWVQVRLPPNWVGWVDESRVLLNL